MHARIIAHKAVRIAGVELADGGLFATMTFPDARLAEFFAARLGWSWFRVDLGELDLAVGDEPLIELPELAALTDALPADEVRSLAADLSTTGIVSIGTLAKADAKGLARIPRVGSQAGSLIRAAKRRMAQLRSAALAAQPVSVPQPAARDEEGAAAIALLHALRDAIAQHGPAQILVPFEEGQEASAPVLDPRLADLVEVAVVETGDAPPAQPGLIEILAKASPDELAELRGIGPKKASEIIESAQALLASRLAAKPA